MARKGIYVNGKEIVARYVGDKLVWKKQTRIVDIDSTLSISESFYNQTIFINGSWTYLRPYTFHDVTIIVDGVTFPHLLKEVKLSDTNPIATVKFYNYNDFTDFTNNVTRYDSHKIQMFAKE